ncbi:PQQ-dependent sugar dehydrogenase [Shimia abyssi]|uniref:Glucose/arabinose dehydrogenase n=1 Tax=Shimia abyssi TaxID=1662395 RepID=A0A2P8FCK7_9RHOB|nr:PQQ-dependent sugar dehydrogenase [Shimia abyssi]PSL19422.1 glucose/arabinose dehydrogenase [Shimia abyssi]
MRLIASLALMLSASFATAQSISTSQGRVAVDAMAEGLKKPWSFGFLPSGDVLITERDGVMKRLDSAGKVHRVSGVPKVVAQGQGGLLDVLVPRDFAQTRQIFLTLAHKQSGGAGTAVARARLSEDGGRLSNVRVIFEITRGSSGGRHFGSRLVEGRDGTLYVTVGDRGDRPSAQDLGRHNGSVLRITKSGQVASGNPFVGRAGAEPEIWSYGHRNPQGMAMDLSGGLWAVEHGAKGGDEVNRVRKGANFGWPVISYGEHYSGGKIGEGTSKSGMEQPAYYWDPSIAPSGMMIYSGKMWPNWRGHIFIGSLKFDYISRMSGNTLKEREKIKSNRTKRVRDVREAPDGSIWFLSEDRGALYRMRPSG